ncbi:MAG: rhodanese-like domain-containing protein [Coriobacteriia bacterium]|nr:rhodanese-like domain-containing protein [Coriobacteriia bacterium]
MSKSKAVLWIVAAVLIAAIGFLVLKPAGGGVQNIDAKELATLVDEGVAVLDVRTAGEYAAGHVPGAVNIPIDQLAAGLGSLDNSKPVAVYCATGARSSQAIGVLQTAGFGTVYHLAQGLVAWDGPVERGEGVVAAAPPQATSTPVLYEFFTDW